MACDLVAVGGPRTDPPFRPEDAVELASELLAAGIDTAPVVSLAILPADRSQLHVADVEPLLRNVLADLDVPIPGVELAGWIKVREIAEAVALGHGGALRLWSYWDDCGKPDELVEMLQLIEDWETSLGSERVRAATAIQEYAAVVALAADDAITEGSDRRDPRD